MHSPAYENSFSNIQSPNFYFTPTPTPPISYYRNASSKNLYYPQSPSFYTQPSTPFSQFSEFISSSEHNHLPPLNISTQKEVVEIEDLEEEELTRRPKRTPKPTKKQVTKKKQKVDLTTPVTRTPKDKKSLCDSCHELKWRYVNDDPTHPGGCWYHTHDSKTCELECRGVKKGCNYSEGHPNEETDKMRIQREKKEATEKELVEKENAKKETQATPRLQQMVAVLNGKENFEPSPASTKRTDGVQIHENMLDMLSNLVGKKPVPLSNITNTEVVGSKEETSMKIRMANMEMQMHLINTDFEKYRRVKLALETLMKDENLTVALLSSFLAVMNNV